jgi:hypothetical protein
MNALVKHQPLTIVLAALALLGALLLALSLAPTLVAAPDTPKPRATAEVYLPDIDQVPLARYAVIGAKPLFAPDRRTETAGATPGTANGQPSLADYRLTGVIISKDVRLALVERMASHQVVTVRPGDDLDGRHVNDISADGVELRDAHGVTMLSVPKLKSSGWHYATSAPISP